MFCLEIGMMLGRQGVHLYNYMFLIIIIRI